MPCDSDNAPPRRYQATARVEKAIAVLPTSSDGMNSNPIEPIIAGNSRTGKNERAAPESPNRSFSFTIWIVPLRACR